MPTSTSNKPTSTSNKPAYKVLDSTSCGIDNFPGSAEAAKKSVEQLIESELKNSYKYYGNLSRFVGGELRTFYIFYLIKS